MFSHLGKTPSCDRWTDRHDDSMYRASIVSIGKNNYAVELIYWSHVFGGGSLMFVAFGGLCPHSPIVLAPAEGLKSKQ